MIDRAIQPARLWLFAASGYTWSGVTSTDKVTLSLAKDIGSTPVGGHPDGDVAVAGKSQGCDPRSIGSCRGYLDDASSNIAEGDVASTS